MVQNAPAVSDHPGCYKLKAKSCKRTIIITIMIWKKKGFNKIFVDDFISTTLKKYILLDTILFIEVVVQ